MNSSITRAQGPENHLFDFWMSYNSPGKKLQRIIPRTGTLRFFEYFQQTGIRSLLLITNFLLLLLLSNTNYFFIVLN